MVEIINKGSALTNEEAQERLYIMLFVVLTELTEVKFNGVIRQLTKLFINKIEKVLRTIITLEEDQDVGYIVSIFETMIVDHPLKRDIFDLSAMRNILISEE